MDEFSNAPATQSDGVLPTPALLAGLWDRMVSSWEGRENSALDEAARAASMCNIADATVLPALYRTVGNPDSWAEFVGALAEASGSDIADVAAHDFSANTSSQGGLLQQVSAPEAEKSSQADEVSVTISQNGTRLIGITLSFPSGSEQRKPDAVARLERLTPHLIHVALLNRKFAALEARAIAAETLLGRHGTGMLIVDPSGRVVHRNATAENILGLADGLVVRRDILDTADGRQSDSLRRAIANAAQPRPSASEPPGELLSISRTSGRSNYEMLISPLPTGHGNTAYIAIFIRDPSKQATIPISWLKQAYGLTSAEARLMEALLTGDSLSSIGQRFGVAHETVRSQIKAIFQKTGFSSQKDLIRIGLGSLASLIY